MPTERERLTALETQVGEINKTTWRIHEALYGNGKPGVLADVHAIKWTFRAFLLVATLLVAIVGVWVTYDSKPKEPHETVSNQTCNSAVVLPVGRVGR